MRYFLLFILSFYSLVSCNSQSVNKIELRGSNGSYAIIVFDELKCKPGGHEDKLIPCNIHLSENYIWENLKGKDGTCDIFYNRVCSDKYGNKSNENLYYKTINLTELNKFQSKDFWLKAGSGGWSSKELPDCTQ